MPYVVVEVVTDPQAAADELTARGADALAAEVVGRGRGTFVLDISGIPYLPAHDRDGAERVLDKVREQRGVFFGMNHFLRVEFDPTWAKQNKAARAALAEARMPRERCAIPAVNAFKRAYYGYGPEWDTPDPQGGGWAAHHARNFRDGALALGNALAGICQADPDLARADALNVIATLGWDGTEIRPEAKVGPEAWIAFSLGRMLRECGDGQIGDLRKEIERGFQGHN